MISDYEKLRLANIEKNQEFLTKLGLSPAMKKETVTTRVKKAPKRKKEILRSDVSQPARRSQRVAELPPVTYEEPNVFTGSSKKVSVGVESKEVITAEHNLSGTFISIKDEHMEREDKVLIKKDPESSNFSRNTNCKYSVFLSKDMICRPIEQFGKAAIMSMSNGGTLPRFSKYSGVVEWHNCVYLWVNLGGKSGYSNAFFDKGESIMWFGGSKMTADTAVIQRLMKKTNKSSGEEVEEAMEHTTKNTINRDEVKKESNVPKREGIAESSDDAVLLFVRVEGESYSCLGRLKYVGFDLSTSPVKIQWRLTDHHRFAGTEEFERILKEGGVR